MRIDWSSAGLTNIGTVRKVNEDAFLVADELELWAVADGMGGHSAGDFASQSIVEALSDLPRLNDLRAATEQTAAALLDVNVFLLDQAAMRGTELIGATIVVFIVRGSAGCCLWAGDCRLYQYRAGHISQLTEDHSRVQELINSGQLSTADAVGHPESNVVTRALGVFSELSVDESVFDTLPGDTYLLCSDGLSGVLSEQDICDCLEAADCASAAQALVALALERGTRDNVTAVVVRAFEDEATQINPAVAADIDDKTLISK